MLTSLRRSALAVALTSLALPLLAVSTPAPVASRIAPAADAAVNSCPSVSSSVTKSARGSGKTVALTFDDGPGSETPKVLEVLRKHNVRATFYMLGANATVFPGYAKQVAAEGHQIGNHSWDHPDFARLSVSSQESQLDRTTAELVKATGVRPCTFRPPGGSLGYSTARTAASRDLKTVLWTTDTMDFAAGRTLNTAGRNLIKSRARSGTRYTHPVLLMHDGGHQRPNLVAELPAIIRWYKDRGYKFVDMRGRSGLLKLTAAQQASIIDYRRSPAGSVASVTAGRGTITIKGWTKDPDSSEKVRVRVRDNQRWVSATTLANKDVRGVTGPRGSHEFSLTYGASRGYHAVCTLGLNIGPGALKGLGCREVTVS